MPGQWAASLWGWQDGRGEGGWLGHRCCHRPDHLAGFQPPRTLFIRLLMLSGGGQESAQSSVPTAGSALHPWECLLLAALGVQKSST